MSDKNEQIDLSETVKAIKTGGFNPTPLVGIICGSGLQDLTETKSMIKSKTFKVLYNTF